MGRVDGVTATRERNRLAATAYRLHTTTSHSSLFRLRISMFRYASNILGNREMKQSSPPAV